MLRRDFESDPLIFLRHLHALAGAWERAPLHFRPQAYFLPADGLGGLDFVGRFERLHADYARLLDAGGSSVAHGAHPTLVHLRQAADAEAAANGGGARCGRLAWARSEELAALVRVVYAADYEALGY